MSVSQVRWQSDTSPKRKRGGYREPSPASVLATNLRHRHLARNASEGFHLSEEGKSLADVTGSDAFLPGDRGAHAVVGRAEGTLTGSGKSRFVVNSGWGSSQGKRDADDTRHE